MKNGKDFIYEYSDLNLFQTRVKILTGEYAGIVLEFGGSCLAQFKDQNTFTFDYTLYEVPDNFYGKTLRGDAKFVEYLGDLLVQVIASRNNDPKEKEKLDEAASVIGKTNPSIPISEKWYPNKLMVYAKQQPKTTLEGF
jgi:hypothetical protein